MDIGTTGHSDNVVSSAVHSLHRHKNIYISVTVSHTVFVNSDIN